MSTEQNPKPTLDPGSNLAPLKKDITKAYDRIGDHKKDRGTANAEITAILTGLEAKGIGKKAMRMAMTYVEFSDDEKAGPAGRDKSLGRLADETSPGFWRELIGFLRSERKWLLTPIIIVLVVFGSIAVLGSGIVAPLIYTMF